jgi:hypothetical protein
MLKRLSIVGLVIIGIVLAPCGVAALTSILFDLDLVPTDLWRWFLYWLFGLLIISGGALVGAALWESIFVWFPNLFRWIRHGSNKK